MREGEGGKTMLLFTAKTRRLIEAAVSMLTDDYQRLVWNEWAKAHPQVRVPDGPTEDNTPTPPRAVVVAALAGLEEMRANKRLRLAASDVSEDEASDLENDLTYIEGVHKLLNHM